MKSLFPLAYFLLLGFGWAGDLIRFSDVFPIGGDNIEEFSNSDDIGEEVLHVGKKSLLGDADVLEIEPDSGPDAAKRKVLNIRFNEEGTKKFAAVTKQLVGGRLAIIVDGKLISAPAVRTPIIGGLAQITGVEESKARQLCNVFRAKHGQAPWPKDKPFWLVPDPAKIVKVPTVPFTEEEYQQIKLQRQSMGFHYLDAVPSAADLDKNLRQGMSLEDVVKIYGPPSFKHRKDGDSGASAGWAIAPERLPENPELDAVPEGFHVEFSDAGVKSWGQMLGTVSRREKVIGLEPPTLKAILPVVDVTNGEMNFIWYVEHIKIPDPTQPVNKRDIGDLLMMVVSISQPLPVEKPEAQHIDANCDFIRTLAHNLPEVEALRKSADAGKIQVEKLRQAVEPYLSGKIPPVGDKTAPQK